MANPILKRLELGVRWCFLRALQIAGGRRSSTKLATRADERIAALGEAPSILLLRQDRLGDVVMSTPIFVALRKRYPGSRIIVLLGKNNQEVEPLLPIECEVEVYRKDIGKDLHMLRKLRRQHIDIAIDLTDNASVTSSILLAAVGAKCSVGVAKENGVVYDVTVPKRDRESVHITHRVLELLKPFGIDSEAVDLRPRLKLPTAKIIGRIGFNVSSRTEERCAPPEASAEIAKGLLAEGFREVLIFAAPADQERGKGVVTLANDTRIKLAPRAANFRVFAEQIAACEYFVTVDTSAIQIAAAAEIPMLLLFRPMPGEHPWTPMGVPFEIHTQFPALAALEARPALALFRRLLERTRRATVMSAGAVNPSEYAG